MGILTTQSNQINHKSDAGQGCLAKSRIRPSILPHLSLQFPLDKGANVLHAPTIYAQVAIAGSGRRPELDRLTFFIKDKFHIIDEPQQEAGEFIMKIPVGLLNEFRARQAIDEGLECVFCPSQTLLIPIGRDLATLICGLRRYAVRTRGAGSKSFHIHVVKTVRPYTGL